MPPSLSRPSCTCAYFSAAAAGVFCCLSYLSALSLGVFTDEAYFASPGMRMALGLPYYQHLAFAGTNGFGPPAIGQYVYAFPLSYMLAAAFKLFGCSPEVLRLFYSVVHLAAGALTFFVVREMFDSRSAHAAFWLFLLQPSFYGVTRDSPDTVFQVLLLQLGLLAFVRERPVAGGFFLGAGVNTKISLLPPAAAMVVAFVIFLRPPRVFRWGVLVVLGGITGCAELIVSNWVEPLLFIGMGFVKTELDGIGGGVWRTAQSGWVFFTGGALDLGGVVRANPLAAVMLIAAGPLALFMRRWSPKEYSAVCFFCAAIGAGAALLCVLPSKIEARHFAYLAPWLFTLAGVAFARAVAVGGVRAVCAAGIFGASCIWDLANDVQYAAELRSRGGVGLHSLAVNELAARLVEAQPRKVVLLDWGTRDSVDFLAQGRLELLDNFQAAGRIGEFVGEEGAVFVSTPRAPTQFEVETELRGEVARVGGRLVEIFRVEDVLGVVAVVSRVERSLAPA